MSEGFTWRTGGCHCGQVRFECTSDLAMVTACNCSICTKKGLHFTFLDPKSFQLRAGEENLKEYLFNKHAIHHQLCVDCGVDVFARGKKPDGSDVDVTQLEVYPPAAGAASVISAIAPDRVNGVTTIGWLWRANSIGSATSIRRPAARPTVTASPAKAGGRWVTAA